MSSNGAVVIVAGSSSIAGTRGSDAACPPSTAATTGQKILQKRWVCDVCKVKWFLDFQEACKHEAHCGKVGNGRGGGSSSSSSSSSSRTSSEATTAASRLVQSDSISSADSNDDNAKSESDGDDTGKGMVDDGKSVPRRRRLRHESKRSRATSAASSPSSSIPDEKKEGGGLTKDGSTKKCSSGELFLIEATSSLSSIPRKKKKKTTNTNEKEKENSKVRETKKPIVGGGGGEGGESGGGQLLASIFLPKTGVRAAPPRSVVDVLTARTEKSSRKAKETANTKAKKKGLLSLRRKEEAGEDDEEVQPVLFPGVSRADYEEHIVAERQHRATAKALTTRSTKTTTTTVTAWREQRQKQPSRIKKRLASSTEVSADKEENDTMEEPKKRLRSLRRKVDRQLCQDDDDDGNDDDSSSSEHEEDDDCVTTNVKVTAIATPTGQKKTFLSKKQLADHHAAEIFARRKRAAAEERERQRKREEQRHMRKPNKVGEMEEEEEEELITKHVGTAAAAAGEVNGRTSMTTLQSKGGVFGQYPLRSVDMRTSDQKIICAQDGKKDICIPAVRFPCPSHVVPNNGTEDDELLELETEEPITFSSSLRQVRETPRYQHLKPTVAPSTYTEEICTQHLPCLVADDTHAKNTMFDLLSSVFDQIKSETNAIENEDSRKQPNESKNQLWVDRYSMTSIPDDILGTNNKEASNKFISFVEEWKLRRHKSVQRMGSAKVKKGGRRKKKNHGYDSDDSFLDDGDAGLENVFLITGPTASGKTRLAHAVAEQSDCVVIEINSSEQRSGAALKRAIQETTQSHSSLAMSKKKQQQGKGTGDLFGSNIRDMESDEHSDSCFDSDEESVKESHPLTIILIDEVDLLFEEDTAFWLALAQVSQKAKCPIVLTASSTPPEMSNFRCQSISLKRPPPEECGIKMAYVAMSEGMCFNQDVHLKERFNRLSLIAEVCQCDMRKILNEMQLFHFAESWRPTRTARIDMNNFGLQLKTLCSAPPGSVDDRPLIISIEPKIIPKDRHTLITITGKNFTSAAFHRPILLIGGKKLSYFQIISSTEIIAICPPCAIPSGVSENAIYQGDFNKNIDCVTCKFLEVVVRKRCANGLILDSNSLLGVDNNSSPESKNWNIEYDIPLRDGFGGINASREDFIRKWKARAERQKKADIENDASMLSDEEEFDKESAPFESNVQVQHSQVEELSLKIECEMEDIDPKTMLDVAISGMDISDETETSFVLLSTVLHRETLHEVNHFSDELGLLSDAILLEDSLSTLAIPSLSGSVEGFGSDTLESASVTASSIAKLCKGKNKKPPSFEALYSSGMNESSFFFGNADSYVTYPIMIRDRQLLSYSELHSRGLGFLDNSGCSFEENSDNSKSGADDESTGTSFLQLQTRVRLEDDILLNSHVSPSLLSLPSLLKQGLHVARSFGFITDPTPLLRSRRSKIATNALGVMHSAVANCDLWYTGLRHDDSDEAAHKKHVWRRDSILDHPLSLDYLPHLRAIAHHERRIRETVIVMMKENGDTQMGGRRTRTSRKYIRRHYLDECADGQDKTIERKALELADSYMIVK